MKVSLAITVLILAAAALMNWRLEKHLAPLQKKQAEMASRKAADSTLSNHPANSMLLVPPDPDGKARDREEAEAREAAVRIFAFAREMEPFEDGPRDQAALSDPVLRRRVLEFMELMASFNSVQLKVLISETLANRNLREKTRQAMMGSFITTLGKLDPHEALAVFTSIAGNFKKDSKAAELTASVLADLAQKDPRAAAAWVRENRERFPDFITQSTREGILKAAAGRDPAAAFELIGNLGLADPEKAVSAIARAAATGGKRDAALEAARRWIQGLPDGDVRLRVSDAAVRILADGVAAEGFDAASQWPASVKLSPVELDSFVRSLNPSAKSGSVGQWMEWMGRTLPADKLEDAVHERISHWTAGDHKAVGNWLNASSDGPARQAAVSAFAEAVAPYEPESAEQWALTLPEGKRRADILQRIREQRFSKAAPTEAALKEHAVPSAGN